MTLVVSLLLTLPQQPVHAANQKRPIRPNIIILLADDLGYGDLGVYGHPSIETPALDRLAAEGQRWTDFYAGAPVCSPSRGALMTGKLPVRSGLYGVENIVFWPDAKGGIPASDRTIAEMLKAAGYDTAMVGKWHLGDKPDALPTRRGFDFWLGTPYSNDIDWWDVHDPDGIIWSSSKTKELAPEEKEEKRTELMKELHAAVTDPNRKSSDWNTALIHSHPSSSGYVDMTVERPAQQETLTRRYTEQAVSFIQAHAKSDRPFFLYVAYNMPHAPTFASKSFRGKSSRGTYGDVVEEIDWSTQEIRDALEEAGLERNTVLIFSSDNGPAPVQVGGGSAGLLKGRKGTTFEGGMRSPGIFWWPDHIKPTVVHGIGSLMDLYATALSLAGVRDSIKDIDSIDLSPAFAGKPSPRNSLEYFSIRGQLLGYRKGAWKVNFTEDGITLSNKIALYNLEQDPAELIDLARVHPDILGNLVTEAKKRDGAIPRAAPIFDQP